MRCLTVEPYLIFIIIIIHPFKAASCFLFIITARMYIFIIDFSCSPSLINAFVLFYILSIQGYGKWSSENFTYRELPYPTSILYHTLDNIHIVVIVFFVYNVRIHKRGKPINSAPWVACFYQRPIIVPINRNCTIWHIPLKNRMIPVVYFLVFKLWLYSL